jgi:hypothetical protein
VAVFSKNQEDKKDPDKWRLPPFVWFTMVPVIIMIIVAVLGNFVLSFF